MAMDEKQLEFLNSIEDIDWNSLVDAKDKNAHKKSNVNGLKLSKGQKKRTRKRMKKGFQTVNSAASKAVETVVFQNPDVDPTMSNTSGNWKRKSHNENASEGIEIDLKKARFEVMKFGMNSMSGTEKYDAETALALRLGAKPGKKTYINYKELQVTRKTEKKRQLEEELLQAKAKPKPKKTKKEKSKHKKADDGVVRIKNVNNIQKNQKKYKK